MKMWIIGLVGMAAIFVAAKFAGLCPGGSCSTSHAVAGTQAASVAASDVNAPEPAGFEPLGQALTDAKSQNKLVLIDVYTDWCHWCKKLDADVYPDPGVQKELHTYFAAAKVNAESAAPETFEGQQLTGRQLASQWNVTGYPTILFLKADGSILERVPGYMPPKDFARLLEYIGTRAYERETFNQWQSGRS